MQTPSEIGRTIARLRGRSDNFFSLSHDATARGDTEAAAEAFAAAVECDAKMFAMVPALANADARTADDVVAKLEAVASELALLEIANDAEAIEAAAQNIRRLVATATDGVRAMKIPGRRWLDTKEAAEYLGYTPGSLENWRIAGKGPKFVRASGQRRGPVRYDIQDLDDWVKGNTHQSTTEAQFKGGDVE